MDLEGLAKYRKSLEEKQAGCLDGVRELIEDVKSGKIKYDAVITNIILDFEHELNWKMESEYRQRDINPFRLLDDIKHANWIIAELEKNRGKVIAAEYSDNMPSLGNVSVGRLSGRNEYYSKTHTDWGTIPDLGDVLILGSNSYTNTDKVKTIEINTCGKYFSFTSGEFPSDGIIECKSNIGYYTFKKYFFGVDAEQKIKHCELMEDAIKRTKRFVEDSRKT